MRLKLSTSLQKNILETKVGGILNRFIMRDRRITLFFEDIIGEYILTCEKQGYEEDIRKLSQSWGKLLYCQLVPSSTKKLSVTLLSKLAEKSWSNLGIVDKFHIRKRDNVVNVFTKNESITRTIGKNKFMPSFFNGIMTALFNSESRVVSVLQTKESCRYQFELNDGPIVIEGKNKSLYDRLNHLEPVEGFTLDAAVRRGILQLKEGNKLYFRGKRVTLTENTIFHLAGNANILLDKVPPISYNFFKEIVEFDSTDEQKLMLLKNLLQVMGWGIIKIVIEDRGGIFIEIKNPPYGLQSDNDNWNFLNNTILGYLWLLDKDFKIVDVMERNKGLEIMFLS